MVLSLQGPIGVGASQALIPRLSATPCEISTYEPPLRTTLSWFDTPSITRADVVGSLDQTVPVQYCQGPPSWPATARATCIQLWMPEVSVP